MIIIMAPRISDGHIITKNGVRFIADEGDLVEIACSYPDMETAIAALQKSVVDK